MPQVRGAHLFMSLGAAADVCCPTSKFEAESCIWRDSHPDYGRPMMMRYGVECHGCGESFEMRLGLAPTDQIKFYFHCPYCRLPIRGTSEGQELDEHKVRLADATSKAASEYPGHPVVVTVDPHMPSMADADMRSPLGAFTMMTAARLTGKGAEEYLTARAFADDAVRGGWPKIRRIWAYYLAGNWSQFNSLGGSTFSTWPPAQRAHEQITIAHHLLVSFGTSICGEHGTATRTYIERLSTKHLAAASNEDYRSMLRAAEADGTLRDLERGIFDALSAFIVAYPAWEAAHLIRHLADDKHDELDALTLFRDDFVQLRDLYQQGFEMVVKTLWIAIAAQNVVKRSNPNDFGSTVPSALDAKSNPTTIKKYRGHPSAFKLAYVTQVPKWEQFTALLDTQIRNSIGHSTARHDLVTGRVVSDKDPGGKVYIRFVAEVMNVFEALFGALVTVRLARLASAPAFDPNS